MGKIVETEGGDGAREGSSPRRLVRAGLRPVDRLTIGPQVTNLPHKNGSRLRDNVGGANVGMTAAAAGRTACATKPHQSLTHLGGPIEATGTSDCLLFALWRHSGKKPRFGGSGSRCRVYTVGEP